MNTPLHPFIVHFPIALSFLLPLLIVIFAWLIKQNKWPAKMWILIMALQLTTTIFGYVALETGEKDEAVVQKVVVKQLIHEHEEAAEIFVGSTVIALVLSIAVFFIRFDYQFSIRIVVAVISLLSAVLACRTAQLGGTLVYQHGAAEAFTRDVDEDVPSGILPTPGLNTSESQGDNESLKADDTDYGEAEIPETDEEGKAED